MIFEFVLGIGGRFLCLGLDALKMLNEDWTPPNYTKAVPTSRPEQRDPCLSLNLEPVDGPTLFGLVGAGVGVRALPLNNDEQKTNRTNAAGIAIPGFAHSISTRTVQIRALWCRKMESPWLEDAKRVKTLQRWESAQMFVRGVSLSDATRRVGVE